jgi:hypothetical protein
MFSGTLTPILSCSDCGSHLMELRGPLTDDALVGCPTCGSRTVRWAEFLSDLGNRIERQQHELQGRRLRYYARKRAGPKSAWHLILSLRQCEPRKSPGADLPALEAFKPQRCSHAGGREDDGRRGIPPHGVRQAQRGRRDLDVERNDAA